jgi:hypothetical protein
MKSLLVHGCYDRVTLKTLLDLGVEKLAFDLRATSTNLIPLHDLKGLLDEVKAKDLFLIFEDDSAQTIYAFLDLLKGAEVTLEFRDKKEVSFYESIHHPFVWMFNPEASWKEILKIPYLKGVLLPLALKNLYEVLPELWDLIEARNLSVFLHASSFDETATIKDFKDLDLSLDLSAEVETSYRLINQEKLKHMPLWRKFHENPLF